ncbi:MAG: AAA-like domain-containing protein [Caldilineaceae bacterium]
MNPEIFANLHNVLAHLYPDESSIRRLIIDSGLSLLRIPLNSSPINNWSAVLTEAVNVNRVGPLLDVIEHEYGSNKEFRSISDSCRRLLTQAEGLGQHVNISVQPTRMLFEDGGIEVDEQTSYPPLPEFDPAILKELEPPTGAVTLRDKFYLEREADEILRDQLTRAGTTTLIRAPRQTGKTSVVSRGIHHANGAGFHSVYVSFQPMVETGALTSLDRFLYELGAILCRKLKVDKTLFDQAWSSSYDAPQKLTFFWEDHIFPRYDRPIILAIDEADSLLPKPYAQGVFSLLRSWHEQRAFDPERWNLLNLVLVISTEPYLLIQDINQSPFNVGERLELLDFSEAQVQILNQRHGSPVTHTEMANFIALLGGHPYLTRLALYEMAKHKKSWNAITKAAMTDQGIFRDHLQDLFKKIYQQPTLQSALLTIIRTHRCHDQSALIRLLRAGVVKGSGDRFSCRCELYRQYLEPRL